MSWSLRSNIIPPVSKILMTDNLLKAGVHLKIAQERLGHSSVAVTLDLYSHVLPGMQQEAVSRIDAALEQAINRRNKTIG